jgi:hypothetical protein
VDCFPRGDRRAAHPRCDGELTVDPARTPEGKGIGDFHRLLERRTARKRLCLHHHRARRRV